MIRRFGGLLALTTALAWSGAHAEAGRPLQVKDIVSTEAFGRASLSPNGRWAVYEKRAAYDQAPRFDLGPRSQWATTDLWIADLQHPSRPVRKLVMGEGPGLLLGEWSPAGDRLVIQRLRGDSLEFGVATPRDGSVQWLGLVPEMPATGAAAAWLSSDRLVLMTRPDGSAPNLLRYYSGSQSERVAAWRRTAEGREPSRTLIDTLGGVVSAERGDPDQAIVQVDLAARAQRVLFRGAVRDMAVSPDGQWLALLEASAGVPVAPDSVVQMEVPNRQRLRLIDLSTGEPRAPDDGLDIAPHLLRWRGDSRALLVFARGDPESWRDGRLTRIGRDGEIVPMVTAGLLTPPVSTGVDTLRGVVADWMGQTPIVYARPETVTRSDWYAVSPDQPPQPITADLAVAPTRLSGVDREAAYFFADGAYWRASEAGLEAVGATDRAVREVVVGDLEKSFRLRANSPPARAWGAGVDRQGRVSLFGLQGDGQQSVQTDPSARVLGASPTAALFLQRTGLSETMRLGIAGATTDLDTVNRALAEVDIGRPLMIAHLDALGRPVQSALWPPAGRTVAEAKGLIVAVYPGLVDSGDLITPLTLTYSLRAAVLAAGGYAVLSPAIPISGEGVHEPEFFLRSVDLAVDAALAAEPALPSDRIAVAGHSFGGQVSLLIAGQTRRYRAYVSWAGPTELGAYWGEFAPVSRILTEDGSMMRGQQGWVEVGHGAIKGPPWRDPENYVTHSPFHRATDIRDPVLLIAADNDFVPLSQAELMFSALYRLGRRARLLTYWGEDHALWSPANIQDIYRQVFSFLDEALPEQDALPTSASTPPQPPPP